MLNLNAIGSGAFLPRGLRILRRNLKRGFARFGECEFYRSAAARTDGECAAIIINLKLSGAMRSHQIQKILRQI